MTRHAAASSASSAASLFVVLLCSLTALPAAAQVAPPKDGFEGPVVVSSGEGVVRRAPDRAWLNVTVESRARGPQEAQKHNAAAMSAVLGKLKAAGVPQDAIQTRGYDLQPEFDYVNGKQIPRGYLARNTVEVRVDELPRVGELLEIAVAAGATTVGGVRFDLKDREAVEREALRLAVGNARQRADAAAAGAGLKVDRVLRIQEQQLVDVPPPRPLMVGMRERVAEAAAPPIEAGELEVRATVTVVSALR